MKVIAFINQKGGVGKTTSTVNIGAGLSRLKKKVLLIDLDPQGNLSSSIGLEPTELDRTVYDLLKKEAPLQSVIQKKDTLWVLPASIALAAFEQTRSKVADSEFLLKEALQEAKGFDYILIDCPPSLGLLTLNALAAAHEVYIPMQTEFLALQGLSQLLETCKVINKRINPTLKLGGIIGMRFNRRKLNKEVIEHLKESFEGKMFQTAIRENIALAEAPSFGKNIYEYKPESIGAQDYRALCKEIVARSEAS